jgi:hypothetical protein
MLDSSRYDFCSEFYTVEKSVEVVVELVGEQETVKIEALRNDKSGRYCARAFIQRDITVQPTYPTQEPESITVWAIYDNFPWTDGDSEDSVLAQALGFLEQACRK